MNPIQSFTRQTLNTLMALSGQPNLSVYMPTHRTFPERIQDPIRLKNLIKDLESLVEPQFSPMKQALVAPFHALVDDQAFWNTCPAAIAIFGGLEHFTVIGLNQTVQAMTHVNTHPYLKPLLRLAPTTERCQVLCLSRDSVCLYEGSSQGLRKVELPEAVPTSQDEALGDQLTPRNQQGHPDGFSGASERGDPMMHESGGGGKQDEINLDRERFFRIVDRKFTEHCSRVSGLPVVLVALPENQAVFRAVSRNTLLLPAGVDHDPATLTAAQLASACGTLMQTLQQQRLENALNRFGVAVGQHVSGSDLHEIARAAAEGRVALLLIEAERSIDGKMDPASGDLVIHAERNPTSDDVLEELMLAVLRCGGEVMVVPAERSMPTDTGAAAVYRY